MARLELLNSRDHGKLRVQARGPDEPSFVPLVPAEFTAAAACCPILFSKDPETGHFHTGALLGFRPGESFLGDVKARTGFEPLSLQREGFFISGEHLAIDRDHPRFSEDAGDPLFDDDLHPSPWLRHIQRVISALQTGQEASAAFIRHLLDLRLIEPVDIEAAFDNGESLRLEGLYTVSLDALQTMDDAAILALFRSGHMQLIHSMAGSLAQIGILARHRGRCIKTSV